MQTSCIYLQYNNYCIDSRFPLGHELEAEWRGNDKCMWYKSKVLKGRKLGKELGFPTVNLNPSVFPKTHKEGVYASLVKCNNKKYQGALYFGPRVILGETQKILEIHILDFNQEIYGKEISWQIGEFVREVRNFSSFAQLKNQLKKDLEAVRNVYKFPH